ncbi:hypothetical protein PC123_g27546 [Phytophthora cactorum]|nr:hypothetical protein PC123_g27546 [Phytophthora cactorum]
MEREVQTIKTEHEKEEKKRKPKREHDAAFQSQRKKIKKKQTEEWEMKEIDDRTKAIRKHFKINMEAEPTRSKSSQKLRRKSKEDFDDSDDADSKPTRSKFSKKKRRKRKKDCDDSDDSDVSDSE